MYRVRSFRSNWLRLAPAISSRTPPLHFINYNKGQENERKYPQKVTFSPYNQFLPSIEFYKGSALAAPNIGQEYLYKKVMAFGHWIHLLPGDNSPLLQIKMEPLRHDSCYASYLGNLPCSSLVRKIYDLVFPQEHIAMDLNLPELVHNNVDDTDCSNVDDLDYTNADNIEYNIVDNTDYNYVDDTD